jgi:hypothetical protein
MAHVALPKHVEGRMAFQERPKAELELKSRVASRIPVRETLIIILRVQQSLGRGPDLYETVHSIV